MGEKEIIRLKEWIETYDARDSKDSEEFNSLLDSLESRMRTIDTPDYQVVVGLVEFNEVMRITELAQEIEEGRKVLFDELKEILETISLEELLVIERIGNWKNSFQEKLINRVIALKRAWTRDKAKLN